MSLQATQKASAKGKENQAEIRSGVQGAGKLVVGILAHVDAGKTTLSEGILYTSGRLKSLGRVDNGDAYLDTDAMEKERGITIFSKEAVFTLGDREITLLDTPGHVDFSAEMERTLQVLDYAILVISGADGVQGHTLTLWRLLNRYQIPVFLFINKMDQPGTDREQLMAELGDKLSGNCVDFTESVEATEDFLETVALCDESLMEQYLETGVIRTGRVRELILRRKLFPCFFGSALRVTGVEEFLRGISEYTELPSYPKEFGARVFKISRDSQGNRLTWLKVTGGTLSVRQVIGEEKVSQLRIYSGERYDAVKEVPAGTVCAVLGLNDTFAGQGVGMEGDSEMPLLEPVLTYALILPEELSPNEFLPKLRMLEEEEPELKLVWDEASGQIQAQMMGEVQIEIMKRLIWDRFHERVEFGAGSIVYRETITNIVEGVGHYEPLRHYAEVHLRLEPGERGSGIQVAVECSEEALAKNWQRLICTHVEEKEHMGVLTGSAITDMRIVLVAGRAHQKHTEGGDFRQATYRAVRQGLMKAESMLLEPYYDFVLELPTEFIGRAMTDIEKLCGSFQAPGQQGESSILRGSAPVATMRNYQKEVHSYTRGLGHLACQLKGYLPCHNEEEVLEACTYEPELDADNPSGSVFCSHGSGYYVPWYEVEAHMHLPLATVAPKEEEAEVESFSWQERIPVREERFMGEEEINEIFDRTYNANRKGMAKRPVKKLQRRTVEAGGSRPKPKKSGEKYLLVDGYNIVFAWEELNELAKTNVDAARSRLMDILCNYQGYRKCTLILVFDAYKVKGSLGKMQDYHNIHVVYTKEAETADQYIEKLACQMGKDYDVTVATSDGLEQLIIRGEGCHLLSARDFYEEVKAVEEQIRSLL